MSCIQTTNPKPQARRPKTPMSKALEISNLTVTHKPEILNPKPEILNLYMHLILHSLKGGYLRD